MDSNDPTTVALMVAEAFERAGIEYAVYGGLLVAAYGEPRETRDADFAVIDLSLEEASRVIQSAGLGTTVSFDRTRFGGLWVSRMAILGSQAFTGINTIDLVHPRSDRYARVAVGRAACVSLRKRQVRVLTPEDFLLFKALYTRERDIDDAASVLRRSGDAMDLELVSREIESLAIEIADFDIRRRHAEISRRAQP